MKKAKIFSVLTIIWCVVFTSSLICAKPFDFYGVIVSTIFTCGFCFIAFAWSLYKAFYSVVVFQKKKNKWYKAQLKLKVAEAKNSIIKIYDERVVDRNTEAINATVQSLISLGQGKDIITMKCLLADLVGTIDSYKDNGDISAILFKLIDDEKSLCNKRLTDNDLKQ